MLDDVNSSVSRFVPQDMVTSVVQAINFFNTEVASIHTVKDMWTIAPVDLNEITTFPTCFAYGLLVFVTGSRIVRSPSTEQSSRALLTQLRLHQYRLELTRALNDELGYEKSRLSMFTLGAIILILQITINGLASAEWQLHYRATWTLINTRGGFRQELNGPALEELFEMLIIGYVAKCTSPSLQQLTCLPDLRDLDLIMQAYSFGVHPAFTCPAPLFAEMIRINDHRRRKALLQQQESERHHPVNQANAYTNETQLKILEGAVARQQRDMVVAETVALLTCVLNFQLAEWAQEKDAGRGCYDAWLRQGRVNISAIVIFAILSLPMSPDETRERDLPAGWNAQERAGLCAEYTSLLAAELVHVLQKSDHLDMSLCWPAIALGVSAAGGPPAHQGVVSQFLLRLGKEHGTVAPYKANEVLQRFWQSGKASWDDCFDRPYAFFT
ncbi:hypothetical protein H2200_013414 [Cladophialophora chaetospira]|uniref:Uncharacterized protein n=1 Tax=Cladophialophora chaetospira TaxID=386627 RepID=A0AA38TZ35_9EURO|nr:hypothetical protein H2200_013414 [Cladophialophora chaetospira]